VPTSKQKEVTLKNVASFFLSKNPNPLLLFP
jgi:hypothetical protein